MSYSDLIGSNPRRLKGLKGDELPRSGPSCLCKIFFFLLRWSITCTDEQHYGSNAAAAAGNDPAGVIGRLGSNGVLQEVEEDQERSCDVCGGRAKLDEDLIFTTRLFTRLYT